MMFCFTPAGIFYWLIGSSSEQCLALYHEASMASEFELLIYLKFFFLTCLLELPFYLAAFAKFWKIDFRKFAASLFLCNIATHPIVYFGIPAAAEKLAIPLGQGLIISELFAIIVEAILLNIVWKLSKKKAFAIAILANIFSWWVGVLILF